MAIQHVKVQINGIWTTLTYNGTSGKYEASVAAPSITSFNRVPKYYPVTTEVKNTAGTVVTINDQTGGALGTASRLVVKEKTKPVITISSPGSGAYVTNNTQPIVFALTDETNGSGINLTTLTFKIDAGATLGSGSAGMVCTASGNGYACTYTPQAALSDGSHTVKINVSDNDGNIATQVTRTFTVDTVPPVLNVSSPSDNLLTNVAALTVSGTTNDATSSPVAIIMKLNNVDQGAVTVQANGSFSKAITLAEGANTIVVTATDAANKVSTTTLNVTLDTSVPQISLITISPNPADAGATMIVTVTVTG